MPNHPSNSSRAQQSRQRAPSSTLGGPPYRWPTLPDWRSNPSTLHAAPLLPQDDEEADPDGVMAQPYARLSNSVPSPEANFTTDESSYLQPASAVANPMANSVPSAIGRQTPAFASPTPGLDDAASLFGNSPQTMRSPASTTDDTSAVREHQEALRHLNEFTGGRSPYLLQNGDPMQWTDTVRGPRPLPITDPVEKQSALAWLNQKAQLRDEVNRLAPAAAYEQQQAQSSGEIAQNPPSSAQDETVQRFKNLVPDTIARSTNKYLQQAQQQVGASIDYRGLGETSPSDEQASAPNDPGTTSNAVWEHPRHAISIENPQLMWVDGHRYEGDPRQWAANLDFSPQDTTYVNDQLRARGVLPPPKPPTTLEKIVAVPTLFLDGGINAALALAGGSDYGADAIKKWGSPFGAARTLGLERDISDEDLRKQVGALNDLAFAGTGEADPRKSSEFADGFERQEFGSSRILLSGGGDYPNVLPDGRRGTVRYVLTPEMLGTGSRPSSSILPPGLDTPNYVYRGHLQAANHGGPGNVEENLVAIPQKTTNTNMRRIEDSITQYVRSTRQSVYVDVTPVYRTNSNVPIGVTIHARSLITGRTLPHDNGEVYLTVPVPKN